MRKTGALPASAKFTSMKRTVELVILLVGCALVCSRVARDHRPPSATVTPAVAQTSEPPTSAYYKCAHEFSDETSDALLHKGYSRTKEPGSIGIFDQLIRREPTSPIGYYHKGDALYDQDRFQEAIAALDQAIALEPGFSNALYLRACCREQGEGRHTWEAGLKDIDLALRLDDDAENHCLRGMLLLRLQRLAEALVEADLAVKMEASRENLEFRADVLDALDRSQEASRERRRAKTVPED